MFRLVFLAIVALVFALTATVEPSQVGAISQNDSVQSDYQRKRAVTPPLSYYTPVVLDSILASTCGGKKYTLILEIPQDRRGQQIVMWNVASGTWSATMHIDINEHGDGLIGLPVWENADGTVGPILLHSYKTGTTRWTSDNAMWIACWNDTRTDFPPGFCSNRRDIE
jgi:hypothetical protein